MNDLFTIGYSTHSIKRFIEILKHYNISALADVRSSPYSKFKPEFNREDLKKELNGADIAYVFMGDCLGARVEDKKYYINGKVDFDLFANDPEFRDGLRRLSEGLKRYRITLMCAEKDPITCHRTILICRNIKEISIKHIWDIDKIENHRDCEQRLLEFHHLNHPNFFISDEQRLSNAYSKQNEKIAYEVAEEEMDDKWSA